MICLVEPIGLIFQTVRKNHIGAKILQILSILLKIQTLHSFGYVRPTTVHRECNFHFLRASMTGLRRNHDHTVGGTATIDRSRRSVFQNLHAFNIVRSQEVNIGHGHSIHYIQRIIAGIHGCGTTNANHHPRTGLTVRLNYRHTGGFALHRLSCRDNRQFLQIFCVYG